MLLHFYERIFISLLHFHERILVSLLHFHERIDYHYALVASTRNLRIHSLNVEYDMPQSCAASRPEISPHLTISTASERKQHETESELGRADAPTLDGNSSCLAR